MWLAHTVFDYRCVIACFAHVVMRMSMVLPAGRLPAIREVQHKVFQQILVVCVGNICRSPTAEVLFRHYVPGLIVSSAGLCARGGDPMDPMARSVLQMHGLDGDRHRARLLYAGLIFQADLILGMERAHVESIKQDAPDASERIFLMDKWHKNKDIPDPFGQPPAAFDKAYRMIDAAVQAWLPHLRSG